MMQRKHLPILMGVLRHISLFLFSLFLNEKYLKFTSLFINKRSAVVGFQLNEMMYATQLTELRQVFFFFVCTENIFVVYLFFPVERCKYGGNRGPFGGC